MDFIKIMTVTTDVVSLYIKLSITLLGLILVLILIRNVIEDPNYFFPWKGDKVIINDVVEIQKKLIKDITEIIEEFKTCFKNQNLELEYYVIILERLKSIVTKKQRKLKSYRAVLIEKDNEIARLKNELSQSHLTNQILRNERDQQQMTIAGYISVNVECQNTISYLLNENDKLLKTVGFLSR